MNLYTAQKLNLLYEKVQQAGQHADDIANMLWSSGVYNYTENKHWQQAIELYENLYDEYEQLKKQINYYE